MEQLDFQFNDKEKFKTLMLETNYPIKADDIIIRLGFYSGRCNYTSRRYVTQLKEDLLNDGCVIISNDKGYFIPRREEDIDMYINVTKKRAITMFVNLKYLLSQYYKKEVKANTALRDIMEQISEEMQ